MANATAGATVALNMDQVDLSLLASSPVSASAPGQITYAVNAATRIDLFGTLVADASGRISGGTVTQIQQTGAGGLIFNITGLSLSGATLAAWVAGSANGLAQQTLFAGDSVITGSGLNDVLRGYGGNDRITGGGGSDYIDGAGGTNTAVFSGAVANYTITSNPNGAFTIRDLRASSPDGSDTLKNIQVAQFSDAAVNLTSSASANLKALATAFANSLRIDPASPDATTQTIALADGTSVANPAFAQSQSLISLAAQVDAGQTTRASALAAVGHFADATTAVAVLSYQFFTGKTPGAAGIDYLVRSPSNPNDLNDPYYAKFNIENRYINFAVNLGKLGAGAANFSVAYGNLSLEDATTKAYTEIFGSAPEAGKISTILNGVVQVGAQSMTRAQYFAFYGTDGLTGIGTKAAAIGFLLVEAVKADVGPYALANDRFMADLSDGAALFNVDLKTTYASALQTSLVGGTPSNFGDIFY